MDIHSFMVEKTQRAITFANDVCLQLGRSCQGFEWGRHCRDGWRYGCGGGIQIITIFKERHVSGKELNRFSE